METQEIILSRLVLGYLKAEKCKSAFKAFLNTSSHLKQLDTSNPKYIGTRFLGLTLGDILSEYSEISQIIQGRLEATNYYSEDHPKESLVDQLLYLLNKVSSSRPSTPGFSTPYSSQAGYRSPSHVDHSDLEATRADALPGNIPNDVSYSPRHKGYSRYGKSIPATSSPIEKDENRSEVLNTEVNRLAENLLDNREFHEKIAQTINRVVEKQFDSTVQAVMQETEQDPIFDKILDDIIGSSNNVMGTSQDPDCNIIITSTKNTSKENKDKKNDQLEASTSNSHKSTMDMETEKPSPDSSNTGMKATQQKAGNNEQMANMDGTIDNYLLTSQCSLVTNPVYINTVTGLLIPPIIDTTKPFMVLNKPQPPPVPIGILSEQDIMKMPIILKEEPKPIDDQNKNQQAGTKKVKTILPKQKLQKIEVGLAADAPEELKDYFRNYKPEETGSAKKPTGLKHVMYPKIPRKSPNPVKKVPKSDTNSLPSITDNVEHDEVIRISSSESKNKTPSTSDPLKKTTPKSGSHVRNLDFSTPPKLNLARRKSVGNQKKAAKTLFQQNRPKAWDSDLRLVVQKENDTPLEKKSTSVKKNKRRGKKAKLNTTEQEGKLLEAAIQTPQKNTKGNVDTQKATASAEQPEKVPDEKKSATPQVKTILSPSKLNASRNNLETQDNKTKLITPDMVKQNIVYPITANRNITSMLETPLKLQLPKTPGAPTPLGFNVDGTPFYEMIKANLNGMDLNSIQTPSALISPDGFPLNTPNTDLISPYPNRPTDYSTGSSYYQPSDNEQNKNLEAHIREVEKSCKVTPEAVVSEHLQIFNKNVIGKKNLNLIRKNMEESEHSSYHSSDEGKHGESSMEWYEKESNDTIIFKKKIETPKRTYSLRTRSKKSDDSPKKKALASIKNVRKVKNAKKAVIKEKNVEKKIETDNREQPEEMVSTVLMENEIVEEKSKPEPSTTTAPKGVSASQFSMLIELEKKRLRMIDSIKIKKPPTPKSKKQANGKFKIKPIAKVYTTKTGKKIESPRKRKRKELKTLISDLMTSDDSDVNFSLTEDEEEKDKNESKTDKNSSDMEAQNLIEGLKERGIHLMHNRSPKKATLEGKDDREIINTSDVQMETIDREYFDAKSTEGEDINIVFDETLTTTKPFVKPNDNHKTEYIGKLYLESIDKEIDIHLKLSNFITLIDIPSRQESGNEQCELKVEKHLDKTQKPDAAIEKPAAVPKENTNLVKEKIDSSRKKRLDSKESASSFHACQSSNDGVDDDLMNFAVSGKEKVTEESSSPRRSKKRRISDESESENSRTKILKSLDVDSFLNTIHSRPKQ